MPRRPEQISLESEYKRQHVWRDWPTVFNELPALRGQAILDLGCGVGDVAAEFVTRGARVIGVDISDELLGEARSRKLSDAEFRSGDLRALPELGAVADGLWCSFAAAYFPDLGTALTAWSRNVRPGGWIALTEVDDLFGHEPLSAGTKTLFRAYAEEALAAGRYDFHMGHKLPGHLERAGFTAWKMLTLNDQELSFSGPASAEVLEAWRLRFSRMSLLRDLCGADFDAVQEEFLKCLTRTDHKSLAKVYCCIATRGNNRFQVGE